ncbi:hypothetical protein NliqN6_1089 [Naganishia liquefaciens]|uniref:FAD dependent oxidoreductase domain-containing protein n=1 Tax=Naganishia liquefaciens TaxID=104408 RepID=A0A8H3YDW8_9TREE|nr:hypothetical protein NliqN6_1089 [Naganishia liquefaciens]
MAYAVQIPDHPLDAIVLGAGVIGLSVALELESKGIRVGIVAKDFPTDIHSVGFASPWAGCNWYSFAGDKPVEQDYDRVTFGRLAKIAKEHPDLVEEIPFFDVWEDKDGGETPWFKDLVPGFTVLHDKKSNPKNIPIPGNFSKGIAFRSFITNAPNYLAWLSQECKKRGIPMVRHRLSALDQAYDLHGLGLSREKGKTVDLVVNCSALGSRSLIGVEDETVYPVKGQTVLVKAPGVKTCYMHSESKPNAKTAKPKPPSYIIPRPGPGDQVILGGTYLVNDYSTQPDSHRAREILQECYRLCPALAGPAGKSWQDIAVISHNVGLRPGRADGPRVELETRKMDGSSKLLHPKGGAIWGKDASVGVIHAYGVGGAGYQSSWGIAEKAASMATQYLQSKNITAKL